jgi:hypothetical protein
MKGGLGIAMRDHLQTIQVKYYYLLTRYEVQFPIEEEIFYSVSTMPKLLPYRCSLLLERS